ncbi:MAG: phosphohydrolase [Spirochaetae bacterium HGW-Spirochaetae-7]|nr:MAG: phosphohydrolase [Spirochaetae bacterium HGW-Spirochaetae-7]
MDCSFSALDGYFGVGPAPMRFELFEGDLVGLAKAVDGLSFPGLSYADAIVDIARSDIARGDGARSDGAGNARVRYRCADGGSRAAYPQAGLARLAGKNSFDARGAVYGSLHDSAPVPGNAPGDAPGDAPDDLVLFEAAVLASRYPYDPDPRCVPRAPSGLSALYQRDLLELVLTGARPDKGLELLLLSGFISEYWPELADLSGVVHAKDYHPEGDAWRHTMETFGHRKAPDLVLSLGLLLHDTGKPDAVSEGGNRFNGHSELGELTARAFLGRLGYSRADIESIAFLVRYHMLPAALPRVPPSSIGRILDDPLFPVLLELYRCDELSTFRGPDGYYDACAAYKAYLKNSRNPYRDSNGKRRVDLLHRNGSGTL